MRRGLSLVELVVAMTVMGVVMAAVGPMIFSSRKMVQGDQLRTSVNQMLRAGADLMGSDIRTAGERFPPGAALHLPPINIDTATGKADELVLRRNLWEGTLPVCVTVSAGSTAQAIRVVQDSAWLNSTPGEDYPECGQPVDSAGWPVSLSQVSELADSIGVGGVLRAYIFDPTDAEGEFINFEVRNDAHTTGMIHRTSVEPFQFTYDLENRPRVYILEERRYRLRNDILELVINEDTAAVLRATADMTGMRARYVLADGSTVAAFPPGSTWRDIQAVELTLRTHAMRGPELVEREITSRYFPRNILSR